MRKKLSHIMFLFIVLIPLYDLPSTGINGIAISGIIGSFLVIVLLFLELTLGNYFKINKSMIFSFFPFALFLLLNLILNNGILNDKSIRHVFFYFYSFIIYSLLTYNVIRVIGLKRFSQALSIGVYLVFAIGVLEMLTYYLFGFESYANFLNHGTQVGVYSNIPRMRSTFNEPSHLALYLIPILPILRLREGRMPIYLSMIILISTFSTSLLISVLVVSILFIPIKINKISFKNILYFIIVILVLFFMRSFYMPFINVAFNKIFNTKIFDSGRYQLWTMALDLIKQKPIIGYGMASYYNYSNYGIFNWYLQVWMELGILGLIALLYFLIIPIIKMIKFKDYKDLYFYLIFLIQMLTMNHYYIPGFWLFIAYFYSSYDYLKEGDVLNGKL